MANPHQQGPGKWSFPLLIYQQRRTTHPNTKKSPKKKRLGDDLRVQAIDAASGTKTWNFTTGNWLLAPPAVSADGSTVFIGADDGGLRSFLQYRVCTSTMLAAYCADPSHQPISQNTKINVATPVDAFF